LEIKATLIRSGMTQSDKEGRYIGISGQPLCDEGRIIIERAKNSYPQAERVYAATSKRCFETASLVYHNKNIFPASGFAPYDYGDFEGKYYDEIENDPRFERWAKAGEDKLPGAAAIYATDSGNIKQFRDIIDECVREKIRSVAIVTHRAAILAILRRYCVPNMAHSSIELEHGGGAVITYDAHAQSAKIEGFILNKKILKSY